MILHNTWSWRSTEISRRYDVKCQVSSASAMCQCDDKRMERRAVSDSAFAIGKSSRTFSLRLYVNRKIGKNMKIHWRRRNSYMIYHQKGFFHSLHLVRVQPRMYYSALASLLMLFNSTLAIPLQIDDRHAIDIFSSLEDFNFVDAIRYLEPDPQDDSFSSSIEDTTTKLFASTPLIADDHGNDMNDFLLSSSTFDASCPAEKKKRDTGVCSSPAELPSLEIPNVLDSPGWQEGSPTLVDPFEGMGEDPCILRAGYPMHVCCRGPLGQLMAGEYLTIENCYLGKLCPFA